MTEFQSVLTPTFILKYQDKDISKDIEPSTISIAYTDTLHASSPDLDITLINEQRKWMGDWLPGLGDRLKLSLQYKDTETVLDCGEFELDDLEYSGAPDVIKIGALATFISSSLRQKNTKAWEKITLKQVAAAIAKKNELELIGEVKDVSFDRLTQNEQSDLEFLVDLADDYGHVVKVEGNRLIFYDWNQLESRGVIATYTDREVIKDQGYRLVYQTKGTYKAAKISYTNPETKKEVEFEVEADDIATGDILKLNERCETRQQAIAKAKEQLRRANGEQCTGSIGLEGEPRIVAGANIQLEGYGKLSGKFQIIKARHSLTKQSGWRVDVDIRRIGRIEA